MSFTLKATLRCDTEDCNNNSNPDIDEVEIITEVNYGYYDEISTETKCYPYNSAWTYKSVKNNHYREVVVKHYCPDCSKKNIEPEIINSNPSKKKVKRK